MAKLRGKKEIAVVTKLPPKDQALIQATLKFANMEEVLSIYDVKIIFDTVVTSYPGEDLKIYQMERDEFTVLEANRKELRRWLANIVAGNQLSMTWAQINKQLGHVENRIDFYGGRITPRQKICGVEACYAYAAALLANESLKLALGRCKACGDFFCSFREGKGRQSTVFCPPPKTCRSEFDKHKQKKHRYKVRTSLHA